MNNKETLELINKFDEITMDIELLPSVFQILIDSLNLDQTDLSTEDRIDIGMNAGKIYDVLALAQRQIDRFQKDREALWKELRTETA